MHGYEMIQEIAERSQNLWRPSPGSVYPTLQLLVDEGLLVARESEGSKKLFELTDEGRTAAEAIETPPWETIADGWKNEAPGQLNLRAAVAQLMGAVAQSAYTSSEEQQARIVDIVNTARREIYQILGESD
jgi:DNA-binding PadR family transcriptional regulator